MRCDGRTGRRASIEQDRLRFPSQPTPAAVDLNDRTLCTHISIRRPVNLLAIIKILVGIGVPVAVAVAALLYHYYFIAWETAV